MFVVSREHREHAVDKGRPNLILILTDHWRGDSLGRLGHPVAETPHLDSLSAEGVTCTSAFTPSPSCIAARRSLMTGTRPTTHGMLGYQDGRPWPYTRTMAGELARAGYQTINIGKTHFHPPRLHLGFEELVIPADYEEWAEKQTGLVRAKYAHGVHANSWMARASHLPEVQMEETWLTDEAMRHIVKRDPERPFFLCLSFNGPHPPWCPPAAFFDLFMPKDIPPPIVGEWADGHAEQARRPLDVNAWRGRVSDELNHRARAGYYAYLAYLDAQIGRLCEFLGRRGMLRETFLLFTADHGEMLGDHNLWRKTYAYDPSARVPFILRPPASRPARRNVELDHLVGLEDIMPTLLDAAGVDVPETVEGRSLLPLLTGDDVPWRETYHHEHSPCYAPDSAYQCLTSREWKYVWNPITGHEQLFQRREDPHEMCDVASDPANEKVLGELRLMLAKELHGRPENLSDGETLIPGHVPVWRDPRDR